MEWAHATYEDIACMVKEEVCVIPIGCIEPHAWHLPTGNDALIAHRWALMAAELEPGDRGNHGLGTRVRDRDEHLAVSVPGVV